MIEKIIKPETELERNIIADPEFIEGALWGKPRNGHPEGQVIYHIGDVLKNVDKYSITENRERLRLIAITHDSFKCKVDRKKPRIGGNHHAIIARRFSERYISDNEVLEIIELHDEAYNSWCEGGKYGKWDRAEARAKNLIERLGTSVSLYLAFYKCDNETSGKERNNFIWFSDFVRNGNLG